MHACTVVAGARRFRSVYTATRARVLGRAGSGVCAGVSVGRRWTEGSLLLLVAEPPCPRACSALGAAAHDVPWVV